jgi:eukaryotic translation initiation factor 2C
MEMKMDNNAVLHRYAIEIQDATPKKAIVDPKSKTAKEDEGPKGKKARRIIELMLKQESDFLSIAIATDFRSYLIANKALNITRAGKEYEIAYYKEDEDGPGENPKIFKVSIAPTRPVSMFQVSDLLGFLSSPSVIQTPDDFGSKEEVIQCLNIIVGYNPKSRDNVTAVRTGSTGAFKYYPVQVPGSQSYNLGAGLEAVRGFFMSVRPATSRLLINVQVKNAAFYAARPLPDVIQEFQGTHRNAFKLANFLKKISINVTHIKRKNKKGEQVARIKMIHDLATRQDGNGLEHPPKVPQYGAGPNEVQFWLEKKESIKPDASPKAAKKTTSSTTGAYITVTKFFKDAYQMVLRRTDLPVINVGSKTYPVYLPAEVCEIRPGQPCNSKLSPSQTAQMIGFAVRPPYMNAQSITDPSNQGGVGLLGFTGNTTLNQFGVRINPELMTVLGRILNSPSIKYQQKTMVPRFASWNLQDVKFLSRTALQRWTWVVLNSSRRPIDTSSPVFRGAMDGFCQVLTASGVQCSPPVPGISTVLDRISQVGEIFNRLKGPTPGSAPKFQFILVILPEKSTEIYNEVKWYADTQVGIHCLCVTANNFMKASAQLNANLALKINLKLGGSNHAVTDLGLISQNKTMVVGIDVTHPSPGSTDSAPSVASMVASTDGTMTQFPAAISIQSEARKEMVDNIGELFTSRLKIWQNKNRALPDNILVYRDGVSEGQYELVLRNELDNMRAACEKLYGARVPKFTVVVVGKRHHTRFYPESEGTADRSSNPPNGVVVDGQITEARNWNFFLQAHTALQGTAKPAHYYVIFDEIFRATYGTQAAAKLEQLTHNMCYMFGRATKAVSIAPPAYYADLVCNRARCYLTSYFDPESVEGTPSTSVRSGQTGRTGDKTSQLDRIKLHALLADSMFYI